MSQSPRTAPDDDTTGAASGAARTPETLTAHEEATRARDSVASAVPSSGWQPSASVSDSADALAALPESREWSERLTVALREVIERHPQLRDAILRSLRTPQLGEYHNEGPRMDAHLDQVLLALDGIADGRFPPEIDAETQALFRDVATEEDPADPARRRVRSALVDYALLHDIAKPDSLRLTLQGQGAQVDVTWEQWREVETRGEPWRFIVDDVEHPVTSISYYHDTEGGKHGERGAAIVADDPSVPRVIHAAMREHEVGYLFDRVSGTTYEEHFVKTGFTPEEQILTLISSYADTMGSFRRREDGSVGPDLGNFLRLLQSRRNVTAVQEAQRRGVQLPENKRGQLLNRNGVVTLAELLPKPVRPGLAERLAPLQESGTLTAEQVAAVLAVAAEIPDDAGAVEKRLGPVLKKSLQHVRGLLA